MQKNYEGLGPQDLAEISNDIDHTNLEEKSAVSNFGENQGYLTKF